MKLYEYLPQFFSPYRCPCPGTLYKWLSQLDHVMPDLLQCHKTLLLRKAMSLLPILQCFMNNYYSTILPLLLNSPCPIGEEVFLMATDFALPEGVD